METIKKVSNPAFNKKKQVKLIKSFPKYLKSKRKQMILKFGESATNQVYSVAEKEYPKLVQETPTFNTPMYDALMATAGKMAALKKGMKATGISTEEFVRFSIEDARKSGEKVPSFLLKLGGKVYLSKLMRKYLKKVGKSVTENGWPTRVIDGKETDDFNMSVETRNCQMVAFWESIGEGDIRPYCTFFDFTTAELLGVGLKQVSTIDSGVCKYCFYKKGKVEWPDAVRKVLTN
ncbi:hypothetical protein [Maribellus mangrovi]|uniref:hypothetical protein n=1 Tax=Maribellus mangrovi TaxID=3133146 RepID=UPI0030EBE0CF